MRTRRFALLHAHRSQSFYAPNEEIELPEDRRTSEIYGAILAVVCAIALALLAVHQLSK